MFSWALTLGKETFNRWLADKGARLGAALAFYSVFSIAPLLVIVMAVAGAFFDKSAAHREIITQMQNLVGPKGAEAIETMIESANEPTVGTIAAIIGVIMLLFGASGVFGELQDAMNGIWRVQRKPGRVVWTFIRDRMFSFAMVLGTGFLLMISLVISAGLHLLGNFLNSLSPSIHILLVGINALVSLAVFSALFTMLFRFVPDARVPWKSTIPAGIITALLFSLGKYLLGAYLGRASFTSAYGAAGSLVVLIVWVYYNAQILFFGAEFSYVLASRSTKIEPKPEAEMTDNQAPDNRHELEMAGRA